MHTVLQKKVLELFDLVLDQNIKIYVYKKKYTKKPNFFVGLGVALTKKKSNRC